VPAARLFFGAAPTWIRIEMTSLRVLLRLDPQGAPVEGRNRRVVPEKHLREKGFQMKKAFGILGLFALLCATLGIGTETRAQEMKTMTWTGWISNSSCGAKDANANGKDCTMKCVKEKGASYVFVNPKTKKVIPIHNQDAVSEANLGQEVKVTGHLMSDGQLHVDSISNAMGAM
jgi:hypothetical protein